MDGPEDLDGICEIADRHADQRFLERATPAPPVPRRRIPSGGVDDLVVEFDALVERAGSAAYPRDLKERARVNEMMDWFNSNFYKDSAYGLIYPQAFPSHKRPNDALQAGTLEWGKQKTQNWLKILDQSLLGPDKTYLCGGSITLADYMGAEMIALGELIGCKYDAYPNITRWLCNMKARKPWATVHAAIDGFAASLKDGKFVAI